MSRLLSVALTERGVVERRKLVTRRLGWWEDKRGRRLLLPGDELTLCRKVMGRKAGEPLVRLAQVRVVDVRREQLDAITDADAVLEAVEGVTTAAEFVEFYAAAMRVERTALVTRIEWEYLTTDLDLAYRLAHTIAQLAECVVGWEVDESTDTVRLTLPRGYSAGVDLAHLRRGDTELVARRVARIVTRAAAR